MFRDAGRRRVRRLESVKPIQIGLLGLGTVGRGTYEVLQRNQHEIARRAGRGIEVAAITVRDVDKARAIVGSKIPVSSNCRRCDSQS